MLSFLYDIYPLPSIHNIYIIFICININKNIIGTILFAYVVSVVEMDIESFYAITIMRELVLDCIHCSVFKKSIVLIINVAYVVEKDIESFYVITTLTSLLLHYSRSSERLPSKFAILKIELHWNPSSQLDYKRSSVVRNLLR